jgi:hypothetical protein
MQPPRYTDDPTGQRFAHVNLQHTDLRATFARVRMLAETKVVRSEKVRPIRRKA